VLTVGGVDTVQPAEGGVSNNCASFGTCIAVVVGKSVVQAGENVCNEVLPLGSVGQRRVVYGHTIG
jgi:hypothetical protein